MCGLMHTFQNALVFSPKRLDVLIKTPLCLKMIDMKRKILFLWALLALTVSAENIPVDKARQMAVEFFRRFPQGIIKSCTVADQQRSHLTESCIVLRQNIQQSGIVKMIL